MVIERVSRLHYALYSEYLMLVQLLCLPLKCALPMKLKEIP